MNAYPFSIFKRADRACYSVSFKDTNGKYLPPVSTKKKTHDEAVQIAFQMLRDGIPQNNKTVSVADLGIKDLVKKVKSGVEADLVLSELKKSGVLLSYVLENTRKAVPFNSYLTNFWDWNNSPYINEKLRQNHSIHKRHCQQQGNAIIDYWEKHFIGRYLGEITHDDISGFISCLALEKLSGGRKNTIIKAGTKPLKYAFAKKWIDVDPTLGHILFSTNQKKRKILTPAVAAKLFGVEWSFERARMANMVASITGMRSGEIASLKARDLGFDCLNAQSSWNYLDHQKTTKNNDARRVEIGFPYVIAKLVELVKSNPWGVTPDSYIFWSDYYADKPMEGYFFLDGLREALVKTGMTENQAKEYDFHGWRHFFTSYMVKKLERRLLKEQTGHKTDDMIELYSDHETVGDRELIQEKQRETFAGIIPALPEPVLLLEYKPQAA